ncbi:MAG: hypothetical protein AAGJ19_00005 [Myxococcota bacterium]
MTFSSNLVIAPDGKDVLSRNLFNAIETGSGTRTEAEVTASGLSSALHEVDPWGVETQCLLIDAILSPDQSLANFTDTDHEEDPVSFSAPSYVQLLKVKGDTSGKDTDNCTNDDTKYHVAYRDMELRVDLDPNECQKQDGSPPDVTKFDGAALLTALNDIASRTSLRVDNVEFSTGSAVFDPDESFLEVAATGGVSFITRFSVDPVIEGRFTIFFDDINSTTVTVTPDGGGYLFDFDFETNGVELRSSCNKSLVTDDGEFLASAEAAALLGITEADLELMSVQEIHLALLSIIGTGLEGWATCELGNELQVNLDTINAQIRLIPRIENGNLELRPIDPSNPLRDIWVEIGVLSQSGPCHENVFAIAHDCNENEEWVSILEFEIASAIATGLSEAINDAPNSMIGQVVNEITSAIGSPTNLVGIYISDSDAHNGDIYVFTN